MYNAHWLMTYCPVVQAKRENFFLTPREEHESRTNLDTHTKRRNFIAMAYFFPCAVGNFIELLLPIKICMLVVSEFGSIALTRTIVRKQIFIWQQ